MAEHIVHNLDEERRPKEVVVLGGVEMDISFIPVGIAIPISKAYKAWIDSSMPIVERILKDHPKIEDETRIQNLINEVMSTDIEALEENNQLQLELVAEFTVYHDPKLDKDWLQHNVDNKVIGFMVGKLINTISDKTLPEVKKAGRELFQSRVRESKKKEQISGKE